MSTYAQRMADPTYAAHVQKVVDEAPPLLAPQIETLGRLLSGCVPARAATRKAA